ncbi:hypothetical protein M1O54_04920 [Dehalococcoidia bacterium]|nr:hypothetical protein [Dehalococcoidia bacterium]
MATKAEDLLKMVGGEFQQGMNSPVEYIQGEELSFTTLGWDDVPLLFIFGEVIRLVLEFGKFRSQQEKRWKLIEGFWSSFLPCEFLRKSQIRCGEQRESNRRPNAFDFQGIRNAQRLPTQGFLMWESERLKQLLQQLYFDPRQLPMCLESLTLRGFSELVKTFKLKVLPTLTGKIPYWIETGGWIPNDDSLALLTRDDSKRPTYQFFRLTKEGKVKKVTKDEVEKIRESIRKTGKALLDEEPVEWIIYDTKKEKPVVIPKRFSKQPSFKEVGAIVIFADHPSENKEILAFMGDRAPASAISPLVLTETHPESKLPFREIFDCKDELWGITEGGYFELVLKFTFREYQWGDIPGEEKLEKVEIVGLPRRLGEKGRRS